MPLPLSEVSTLLQRHEDIELRKPPILLRADKEAASRAVTESWFKSHRTAISQLDVDSSVALLSTLLPERRTDRVYNIGTQRLCLILSRCLGLSAARAKDLQAYNQPGRGDLATCLERVLVSGGPPAKPAVTIDEVDEMLHLLAGGCRFSDPTIARLPPGTSEEKNRLVGNIFKRLLPRDAKWLTRLILKDFTPVRINESQILKCYHFMLPGVLRFQNSFDAAVHLLKGSLDAYPSHPDQRSERLHFQSAASHLKPTVGVKVGRPNFHNARGVDHCIRMLGGTQWVLERKYDGEYCEIHIDLSMSSDPSKCISIFSKSEKNSTADRQPLHQVLIDSLRLGKADCKIKGQAILLGEMVVYSDKERCVLPFDNIRKHVLRSGQAIGTDVDSLPQIGEHLAVVFFDLLLLDDEIVMNQPIEERRQRLRRVYRKIGAHAMGAEWKNVNFANESVAKRILIQQFAASIAQRCEGLVLKPCGVPYFSLEANPVNYSHSYIKLKKDYIAGMGDEADFAVVGGSYNAQQAASSGVAGIKWTNFHLGCLVNKAEVIRFDARPRFKVVCTVQAEHCIPKPILQAADSLGTFCAVPYDRSNARLDFDLEITAAATKISTVFRTPFVFDVLGSGFEKPSNCNFYMLRHARVTKLHEDRTWRDAISMQEVQEQAAASRQSAPDSESQETRRWLKRLETKTRRKFERERTATPRTRTTATPSTTVVSTDGVKHTPAASGHRDVALSGNAASPDTSELYGTTLVETSTLAGQKRPRGVASQTPCPTVKKQRVEKQTIDHPNPTAPKQPSPLSDITNQAPALSSQRRSSKHCRINKHSDSLLRRLSSLLHKGPTSSSPNDKKLTPCIGSFCPLANSTIHLSPCVKETPYITSDLLGPHLASHLHHQQNTNRKANSTANSCSLLTLDLGHWCRDTRLSHDYSDELSGNTIPESPSYGGRKKIVLVESRRPNATGSLLEEVRKMVGERNARLIEVWDWRVLEERLGVGGTKGRRNRDGEENEEVGEFFLGTVRSWLGEESRRQGPERQRGFLSGTQGGKGSVLGD